MKKPVLSMEIRRYEGNCQSSRNDYLAIETSVEVIFEGRSISVLHCSPGQEDELARGYLFASGMLKNPRMPAEIQSSYDRTTVSFLTSLAGVDHRIPDSETGHTVSVEYVYSGLDEIKSLQSVFKKTGATHAALCKTMDSTHSFFSEDISRHNAMMKALGAAIKNGVHPDSCILFTTGRLTGSLVRSCCYANLAAVASKTVATTEGISKARNANLTLIGSLSSSGFWLYHEGTTKIV